MDHFELAKRALSGQLSLERLLNLRTSFGSLDASLTIDGKIIMEEITKRIDDLKPDTIGAKWRRCLNKFR